MKLKIVKFKSVKSTNDEAIKLIKNKDIYFGLAISDIQTKGRGTMGKAWISEKGNLFFSIFFQVNLKKFNVKDFLIINVKIIKKILNKFSHKPVTIKAPNDLLIEGKKLCGILQEIIEHQNNKYLITGIGINSKKAPEDKEFKATSLSYHSKKIIKNHFIVKEIKKHYTRLITDLDKHNFTYIKKKYI
tara:strand:+ start:176 stop:739 length:564 start_codon:yes stop_codon:yes gene_type:complete